MFPPQIGQFNDLVFSEEHEAGILLDGGEDFGLILLPKRYVPESINKGDTIRVFLYLDSEDRLIATTENPKAVAGEFAYLEVIDSTRAGSFLDWGLPKDLLLPFGEQPRRSRVGDCLVVFIYLDEVSGRLVASSKLKKFVFLFLFAASSPLGGIVGELIVNVDFFKGFSLNLLAISCGMLLHITTLLIFEDHHNSKGKIKNILTISAGIVTGILIFSI